MTDLPSHTKIPDDIRSLFHNYDPDSINLTRDARLVILTILQAGSWEQIRWVVSNYGMDRIEKVVQDDLYGMQTLARPVANYWSIVLWGKRLPPLSTRDRWKSTRKVPRSGR